MAESTEFGAELSDFRSRVEELKSARSLPPEERMAALDAALFELQHAAEVLWPRYEELAASARHNQSRREEPEVRLLRGVFQRLPLPVALMDRATVLRRVNVAATDLFGLQTGYATGRPLTGALSHDSRAAFRSQVAAVARGEGSRSLVVRQLKQPGSGPETDGVLRATLTALRPPDEPRPAVLAVFQHLTGEEAARGTRPERPAAAQTRRPRTPRPDLAEVSRHAELLDLVDDMAARLLWVPPGDPKAVFDGVAGLLRGRFADWVIADLVEDGGADAEAGAPGTGTDGDGNSNGTGNGHAVRSATRANGWADGRRGVGPLRRITVLGPAAEDAAALSEQDPADCPLVVEAVRDNVSALRLRPDDPEAFGRDASGASVLVSVRVTSLLCVPLCPPPGCGRHSEPLGTLTLFRTGGRRAFEMAEAGVVDRMSRHIALALSRPAEMTGRGG